MTGTTTTRLNDVLEKPIGSYPVSPADKDTLSDAVTALDTMFEQAPPEVALFDEDDLPVHENGHLQTNDSPLTGPWETITSNVESLGLTTAPASPWETSIDGDRLPCLATEANNRVTKLKVEYRPTDGIFVTFESRPTSHESEFLTFFRGTLQEWGEQPAIDHFESVPRQLSEVFDDVLASYTFIYHFWPFLRPTLPDHEFDLTSDRAQGKLEDILTDE